MYHGSRKNIVSSNITMPTSLARRAGGGARSRQNRQSDGRPAAGRFRRAPDPPLLERTRLFVEEEGVADADLADAGVILGTGFAPFTGGPLNYLKQKGEKKS